MVKTNNQNLNKNNKLNRFKKGVSLTEVVVSMAIIIIFSVLTFIICTSAINQKSNNFTKYFFVTQTSNIIKCYNQGEQNYSKGMKLLFDLDGFVYNQNQDIYINKDLNYSFDSNNCKYKISLQFSQENFKIQSINCGTNKTIFVQEVAI